MSLYFLWLPDSYWLPKNINNNKKLLPGTINELEIQENSKITAHNQN